MDYGEGAGTGIPLAGDRLPKDRDLRAVWLCTWRLRTDIRGQGALRTADNNFGFVLFDDLNAGALLTLIVGL